jgi:very-short-patch-repair endonuclease
MHARVDPPRSLLRLAHRQGGVITTEQAREHGLGRRSVERLVAEGHWQRLVVGLCAVTTGDLPWIGQAWAGVLLGAADARLGGAAAGHLHGIVVEPPIRFQVLIPEERRRADQGLWTFTRERPGDRVSSTGLPPRTTIEDTVLDLCILGDEAGVVDLVTRAVQTRRTTAQLIRRRLSRRMRIRGRKFLEAVLAEVDEGAQSTLEIEYLRNVERAHGLPRGRRQVRSGVSVRDVVYQEWATIVELDGRRGHEGTGRFRDMSRDNLATVSGAATLRFGWHDTAGDPCQVAVMVATVLQSRGWPGQIHCCRRCHGRQGGS